MQKDPSSAFRTAFDDYADELFRHALYRLSDREKAVDAVQDTFLRAWDYVRTGAPIGNMRAFLYRTLRNLIIDEYRRKKAVSLDAIEEAGEGGAMLASDEDALERAVARLDGERALALVSELPDPYAEVILLRYVDGLAIGEIAERVEVSENLVSVRLHRALKMLHDRFSEIP
jgi:RNA polymerase sigma-70 factor (ECF subfamily)